MKVYNKPTGIKSHKEVEADFFEAHAVFVEVRYAPTKQDLIDGKNIHSRMIQITPDTGLLQQIENLGEFQDATIV